MADLLVQAREKPSQGPVYRHVLPELVTSRLGPIFRNRLPRAADPTPETRQRPCPSSLEDPGVSVVPPAVPAGGGRLRGSEPHPRLREGSGWPPNRRIQVARWSSARATRGAVGVEALQSSAREGCWLPSPDLQASKRRAAAPRPILPERRTKRHLEALGNPVGGTPCASVEQLTPDVIARQKLALALRGRIEVLGCRWPLRLAPLESGDVDASEGPHRPQLRVRLNPLGESSTAKRLRHGRMRAKRPRHGERPNWGAPGRRWAADPGAAPDTTPASAETALKTLNARMTSLDCTAQDSARGHDELG